MELDVGKLSGHKKEVAVKRRCFVVWQVRSKMSGCNLRVVGDGGKKKGK